MDEKYSIEAKDSARVGIQASVIQGDANVSLGSGAQGDARSAAERITEIRQAIDDAAQNDAIGADVYAAAGVELDEADRLANSADSAARGKSIIALKRLSGLVGGVADLAIKIAGAIAAVEGIR